MNSKFFIRPSENEWIKTEVILTDEHNSAIHGVVKNSEGRIQNNALVTLYKSGTDINELVACTSTDEMGEFMFGPLEPKELYLIKLYKNNKKIRELEIITD